MGHFYDREGNPQYTYNGRDSTLRECRKFGWVPSVTEILQVVAKPALTNWMVDQAILAALTLPRVDGETEQQYIARVKEDSRRQAKEAAAKGEVIHDASERHMKGMVVAEEYLPHAQAVRRELDRIFPGDEWIAEKSFAHRLGFGGKSDIHSRATRRVPDIKSKDGTFVEIGSVWHNIPNPADPECKPKRMAFDQFWQLAAYQVGLGLADPSDQSTFAPGAAIFVSRTHPGQCASHVWTAEQMYEGWQIFAAALALHKLLRGYDGGW